MSGGTFIKVMLPDKYKHLEDNPEVREWLDDVERIIEKEYKHMLTQFLIKGHVSV